MELTEGAMLSRLVEADRMSFDTEVAEVTVEARTPDLVDAGPLR